MLPRIYYNSIHHLHACKTMHPEAPLRVETIMKRLQPYFDQKRLELLTFHSKTVPSDAKCQKSWRLKDGDTYKTAQTDDVLAISRDMISTAVKALMVGETNCAFVLCRPPGHHAAAKPAGFCHENNAWFATELLHAAGKTQIGIFDWDAHHGDGTEKLVRESDLPVRFVSTHAYGLGVYPGTGAAYSDAKVMNIPLDVGTRGPELLAHFRYTILPFLRDSDILIISAGYDGHEDDPMELLKFTSETYKTMTEELKALNVPILFLLEGGYNPNALAECVEASLTPWIVHKPELQLPAT